MVANSDYVHELVSLYSKRITPIVGGGSLSEQLLDDLNLLLSSFNGLDGLERMVLPVKVSSFDDSSTTDPSQMVSHEDLIDPKIFECFYGFGVPKDYRDLLEVVRKSPRPLKSIVGVKRGSDTVILNHLKSIGLFTEDLISRDQDNYQKDWFIDYDAFDDLPNAGRTRLHNLLEAHSIFIYNNLLELVKAATNPYIKLCAGIGPTYSSLLMNHLRNVGLYSDE